MEILHPTHKSSSPGFIPRAPLNSSPELVHRVHPQILFLEFIPRLHPQSSSPEFGPSSVLGPGTCFKAYNLIQSQDAWLELKNECYKKLVKKFSLPLPPSPLLLTPRSAELKLSALKKRETLPLSSKLIIFTRKSVFLPY